MNKKPDSIQTLGRTRTRIVDLFCGAGGLSCGFDFSNNSMGYTTVLGLDIEPSAVALFNQNFRPTTEKSKFEVGRVADLNWFSHLAEIRLFFLSHISEVENCAKTHATLSKMGFFEFLSALKSCDDHFGARLEALAGQPLYKGAVAEVPKATSTLALVKTFFARFGLHSVQAPKISLKNQPWTFDYSVLLDGESLRFVGTDARQELIVANTNLWAFRVDELRSASEKKGRGQNSNNASRLGGLVQFLDGKLGEELRDIWVAWQSHRDTIRSEFCIKNATEISRCYFENSKVDILLGGPPCKGFSRIGRAVIASLRDQGVHAWSNKEFGDERNALMIQYVLFLEALQPDVFLFENVSNFKSALKTPDGTLNAPDMLEGLISDLSEGELDYRVHYELLNAKHFDVPQDRRRFIMFGVNADKVKDNSEREFFRLSKNNKPVNLINAFTGLSDAVPTSSSAGPKSDQISCVYDLYDERQPEEILRYLKWVRMPQRALNEASHTTDAHIYREGREDDRVFATFVAPGIRWMDLKVDKSKTLAELRSALDALANVQGDSELCLMAENLMKKVDGSLLLRLLMEHTKERFKLDEQHLLNAGYLKNGGSTHGDWFERLDPMKPCRTIVAHIGKDTYAYWHPFEARSISIREAARIQSFPDCFKLGGSGIVDTYSAIGNAVPPLMAAAFAHSIERMHFDGRIFSGPNSKSSRPVRLVQQSLSL